MVAVGPYCGAALLDSTAFLHVYFHQCHCCTGYMMESFCKAHTCHKQTHRQLLRRILKVS